jgi:hypothetical protein
LAGALSVRLFKGSPTLKVFPPLFIGKNENFVEREVLKDGWNEFDRFTSSMLGIISWGVSDDTEVKPC